MNLETFAAFLAVTALFTALLDSMSLAAKPVRVRTDERRRRR